MSLLHLTWIAFIRDDSIHWRLIDREGIKLSLVYVLKCQETLRIKIGITQHIDERLKHIQSMSPTKLKSWTRFPTIGQGVESFLHNQFKQYRLHGEWFSIPTGMDGFLVELSKKAGELCYQCPLEKIKLFDAQCALEKEHENQSTPFGDF